MTLYVYIYTSTYVKQVRLKKGKNDRISVICILYRAQLNIMVHDTSIIFIYINSVLVLFIDI